MTSLSARQPTSADPFFAEDLGDADPAVAGAIAAKAVAFGEALRPGFRAYAHAVVDNARVLAAERLRARGAAIVSGGTDTHVVLVDLRPLGHL